VKLVIRQFRWNWLARLVYWFKLAQGKQVKLFPVKYDDEITEEQANQINELVRKEFETGDWVQ
jgi:hypothetical protein